MNKIFVPPIKIQGIKTKLVPLIKENVNLDDNTLWVEPFMGSGVVGFNVRPKRAIFADINPHIIDFYNAIKLKHISHGVVKAFLTEQGKILSDRGETYYYEIRENFNKFHSPLDFLFLNRSCFNGMIRFNSCGNFNVPFCRKADRFSKAYITKIVNQVQYVEECFADCDWKFENQDFRKTLLQLDEYTAAFIYCDPPYIDRNNDYYESWTENTERDLYQILTDSKKNFMLSTWEQNKFRANSYIYSIWKNCRKISEEHFYHVGAKEINRHSMTEALLMNY